MHISAKNLFKKTALAGIFSVCAMASAAASANVPVPEKFQLSDDDYRQLANPDKPSSPTLFLKSDQQNYDHIFSTNSGTLPGDRINGYGKDSLPPMEKGCTLKDRFKSKTLTDEVYQGGQTRAGIKKLNGKVQFVIEMSLDKQLQKTKCSIL